MTIAATAWSGSTGSVCARSLGLLRRHSLWNAFGGSGLHIRLHEPNCIARDLFKPGLTQAVEKVIDAGLIFIESLQSRVSRCELWIELS